MLVDYHVHIERGPYDFAWLDRFLLQAEARGVEEIGIVEHSHIFEEFNSLYTNVLRDESPVGQYQDQWLAGRQVNRSVTDYLDFMGEAKRRGYPVKVGFEICYFPEFARETEKILANLPVDFVIGSLHWLNGWGFDHPQMKEGWVGKNKADVAREYNQVLLSAIRSGLFDIIGHIDSIKAFSPWGIDGWLEDDIVSELLKHNLCLELSTGVKYRRKCSELSPAAAFLEQCSTQGIPITLSSDAHDPEGVGMLFNESVELAKRAGYTQLARFTQRQRSLFTF